MHTDNFESEFRKLDEIAAEGYNFGFHIRYSRPSLVRMAYSPEWSQRYSAEKFILNDPSVVWGLINVGQIRWSEIELPDPLGVFTTAQEYGYRYGAAFGIGKTESKTLGSCGRSDREFTDAEMSEITRILTGIHDKLGGGSGLKGHQKEALQLYGEGRTYEEICAELGISKTALRNRLSGARRTLGVNTNSEAFQVALEQGQVESKVYTGITKGLPAQRAG